MQRNDWKKEWLPAPPEEILKNWYKCTTPYADTGVFIYEYTCPKRQYRLDLSFQSRYNREPVLRELRIFKRENPGYGPFFVHSEDGPAKAWWSIVERSQNDDDDDDDGDEAPDELKMKVYFYLNGYGVTEEEVHVFCSKVLS